MPKTPEQRVRMCGTDEIGKRVVFQQTISQIFSDHYRRAVALYIFLSISNKHFDHSTDLDVWCCFGPLNRFNDGFLNVYTHNFGAIFIHRSKCSHHYMPCSLFFFRFWWHFCNDTKTAKNEWNQKKLVIASWFGDFDVNDGWMLVFTFWILIYGTLDESLEFKDLFIQQQQTRELHKSMVKKGRKELKSTFKCCESFIF